MRSNCQDQEYVNRLLIPMHYRIAAADVVSIIAAAGSPDSDLYRDRSDQ